MKDSQTPELGAHMRSRVKLFAGLLLVTLALAAHYRASLVAEEPAAAPSKDPGSVQLEAQFSGTIRPFLQKYCIACHGQKEPEGDLDLSAYTSMAAILKDMRRADMILHRLKASEMPPKKAKLHPLPKARQQVVAWLQTVRDRETQRNAGDPGVVLARRLSNAEYNYTIRDLTGVDIRPTREFPVDPANTAGFDNSGESLVMSTALLKKYLAAAHEVANHMYLRPHGFAFAPHPMLVETDRDKLCVMQIIAFYHRQNTDYADYFQAAWLYKHRAALGKPGATLAEMAAQGNVSPKYLATIWKTLEGQKVEVGPLVKLQELWSALPAPALKQPDAARAGCEKMKDYVVQLRKKVECRFYNIQAGRVGAGTVPMMIRKNVAYATHRRSYDPAQLQVEGEDPPAPYQGPEPSVTGDLGPGATRPVVNAPGDPDLFVPEGQRARHEEAFAAFCSVFPDMFYMQERGRNYHDVTRDRNRFLSAGFHNILGYFRDDQALSELILDEKQQKELDEMWLEMDFVASTTARMFIEIYGNGGQFEGRGGLPREAKIAPAAESKAMREEWTSEAQIKRLEAKVLANAAGGNDVGIKAVKDFFAWINTTMRTVAKAHVGAEPSHLEALLNFAARAYRRPLAIEEKADLLAYYKSCREKDGLDHESAIREGIVSVLMAPDFCYRIDFLASGKGIQPLSDYDLASRLSYFLWSSMPDEELLARAAAGDLHEPRVVAAQARRMLKDPRIRDLAVEFGGNWLDFRRFEELNSVDRERFPSFTSDLRQAMFEEPVRYLTDVFQKNRSVLDLLYGQDTFVNPLLAKHYGIPIASESTAGWIHVDDARPFGRGGLLPMAVFLTKNSPGLRTSPVKRGNWVVKNVLGEQIPAPPPVVPELPKDEAKLDLPLRDLLARHRADPSCAGCHARFDSFGLVFEGFGPIGERRAKDLSGRQVDVSATFPSGDEGAGLDGLRQYIRAKRQNDFVQNLAAKLFAYALGRGLIQSDDLAIRAMQEKLMANSYRFDNLVESIVTSRQFLFRRGGDETAERKKE
ncbi:MAG TPA: DUF1592 domain-containing protein [Gemmataceae bacterium]|nr:DUF1592 domain-containing protein [Gemmataceae bacterium]